MNWTDGYDAGLKDAAERTPRRFPRPRSRTKRETTFEGGYDAGYEDGTIRRARQGDTRQPMREAYGYRPALQPRA